MRPEQLAARFNGERLNRLQLLKRIGFTVEGNVKREVPVKSGHLRRSITSEVQEGAGRVIVGTNLDYALPVHEGSKAHTIVAKTKKALYWKGAAHPIRSVRHPGTKANPFMVRGLDRSRGEIERLAEDAGYELFARIGR